MRAFGRALLFGLVLTLTGCTGQFVYKRLDFLIPFYFSQRVTLDDAQEAQLKAAVRTFTSWHRSSELKRYSEFVREVAERAERPATRAEIDGLAREMESFWDAMMVELLPEGGRWLRSLSPKQVDELIASYAEDDEDEYEEHCEPPPEKRIARRTKSLKRSVKKWAGALEDTQEAVIERTSREMRLTGCDWLESRAQWRAELRHLLVEEKDEAAVQEGLRRLMAEPEHIWTAKYREGFMINRGLILDMIAELDATWNEKQRQSIVRRLTGIADDLDELAAG